MSYLDFVDQVSLFRCLFAIDRELAEKARAGGCPLCGGPLHSGRFERKPRGEHIEIPAEFRFRLGLCCGDCRRRTLPESVLYCGRRVYWGCIVVLVTGVAQGLERSTLTALCDRFGVSRRTLKRWLSFFAVVFPKGKAWQSARGRVPATVSSAGLPRQLLAWFFAYQGPTASALMACLRLLSAGNNAQ